MISEGNQNTKNNHQQIVLSFFPNFVSMSEKILQSNNLEEVDKFKNCLQNLQAMKHILKSIQKYKSKSLLFVTCELLLKDMQKEQKEGKSNTLLMKNDFIQIQNKESPYEYYDAICTFFSTFLNNYHQSLSKMQKNQIKQVIGFALDQCFTFAIQTDQYNLKFIEFYVKDFNPNLCLLQYAKFQQLQHVPEYNIKKLEFCFQILGEVIQRRNLLNENHQSFAQFMKRHRIFKNVHLQDVSTFCIRYCKIILNKFNKNTLQYTQESIKDSIILKTISILQKIITFNYQSATHSNPQYSMLDNCVSSPVSSFPNYLTQFSQDYTLLNTLNQTYQKLLKRIKSQTTHQDEYDSILQSGIYSIIKMYGRLFFIKKYDLSKEQINSILRVKFKIIQKMVTIYSYISLKHIQYMLQLLEKTVTYQNTVIFDYSGTKDISLCDFQIKNQLCVNFVKNIISISKLVLQDIYWKVLSECEFFKNEGEFYTEQSFRNLALANRVFVLIKNTSQRIHLYLYNQHSSQLQFFQTIYALTSQFMKKFNLIANQLMKKFSSYEHQNSIIELIFTSIFFFVQTDPIIAKLSNTQFINIYRQDQYLKNFAQQLSGQIISTVGSPDQIKLLIYLFTFMIVANQRLTIDDEQINQIIKNVSIHIIKSFNPNQAIWHLIKKIINFTFSTHSKCNKLFNSKKNILTNTESQMEIIGQNYSNFNQQKEKSFLQTLVNSTFQHFTNIIKNSSKKNFQAYISLIILISNRKKQFQDIGISLQEEIQLIQKFFAYNLNQENLQNSQNHNSNNFCSINYLQQSSNLLSIYLRLISSKFESDQIPKFLQKLYNLHHNLFMPFRHCKSIESLIKYLKLIDIILQKQIQKKVPIELLLNSLGQFSLQLKKITKIIFKNPLFHDVFKSLMLTILQTICVYQENSDIRFRIEQLFYDWVKQLGKNDNSETVLFIWAKFAQLNPLGKLLPIYQHLIKINSKNFEFLVQAYSNNLHRLQDSRLFFMMQCFDKKINWLQQWWNQIILRDLKPQINTQIYLRYMIKGDKKNNRTVLKLFYKIGKYDKKYDKFSADKYKYKDDFINNWLKEFE